MFFFLAIIPTSSIKKKSKREQSIIKQISTKKETKKKLWRCGGESVKQENLVLSNELGIKLKLPP